MTTIDDTAEAGRGGLEQFTDTDGIDVGFRRWLPTDPAEAKAVVVIAHGASEHSGRYARFAGRLNDHGYAVYALDHRGHGATSAATGPGKAGPRGWEGMLDDLGLLVDRARAAHPGAPLVLFGHSMGSFLSQLLAQRRGGDLDGLVLSGSSGAIDGHDDLVALGRAMADGGQGDEVAPLFATFNTPFEPARTPFDWLSRDPDEVDRYVADPWCGDDMPLTFAFALDMLEHLAEAWDPANEARIPTGLPVLFLTGEADPVSDGGRTVRVLEARYREAGLTDVTAQYFPDARHELLNETNRDEVEALVVAWLDRVTAR